MYLPEAFQKKMKAILGEEYDDFLAGFEKPRHYGLRVNTAKITVEEFKELVPFHLTQIPWVENGFYYEEEDAPTRHPYYYAGLYYIQEPSAMTTASRLPVGPGERVLDLCAAPGGKATELGAKLFGEGLLVANDISASRVKALLKNIEVMGIPNSFLLNEVPAKIAEHPLLPASLLPPYLAQHFRLRLPHFRFRFRFYDLHPGQHSPSVRLFLPRFLHSPARRFPPLFCLFAHLQHPSPPSVRSCHSTDKRPVLNL